jgi:hypothetical protein
MEEWMSSTKNTLYGIYYMPYNVNAYNFNPWWMTRCNKDFGELLTKSKFSDTKELNSTQSHNNYYKEARGKF